MTTDAIDHAEWRALLRKALEQATTDIFGNTRFDETRFGIRTEGEPIAVLSFHGDDLEGGIGLSANPEFLRHWHPVPDLLENTTHELEDWLGELLNRIVGRLKAHLAQHGANVQVSTPVVLRGTSVTVRPQTGTGVATYTIGDDSTAHLWSQLRLSRTQVTRTAGERCANEGEIIRL